MAWRSSLTSERWEKSLWVLFGSNFAGFCWSLEIVGVWVRFCWVFVGHLWVLFWWWWVMGNEARVVCLSFVASLDGGGGGGFSGREIEEER